MQTNFYRCFRHETSGSEDFSKIAKFWGKTTSHGHHSEDVDEPDLLQKVITDEESWMNGYDIETKAPSSQWKRPEEPSSKKHIKFG